MPNDLTVPPVGARLPAAPDQPTQAAAPAALPAAGHPGYPNPSLRLDPALGIVVIEFHDGHGAVRDSIPTQHQLDAYRNWERTGKGAPPHPAATEAAAAPGAKSPESGIRPAADTKA